MPKNPEHKSSSNDSQNQNDKGPATIENVQAQLDAVRDKVREKDQGDVEMNNTAPQSGEKPGEDGDINNGQAEKPSSFFPDQMSEKEWSDFKSGKGVAMERIGLINEKVAAGQPLSIREVAVYESTMGRAYEETNTVQKNSEVDAGAERKQKKRPRIQPSKLRKSKNFKKHTSVQEGEEGVQHVGGSFFTRTGKQQYTEKPKHGAKNSTEYFAAQQKSQQKIDPLADNLVDQMFQKGKYDPTDISPEEWKNFLKDRSVSSERLAFIREKIANSQSLSVREAAVYKEATGETYVEKDLTDVAAAASSSESTSTALIDPSSPGATPELEVEPQDPTVAPVLDMGRSGFEEIGMEKKVDEYADAKDAYFEALKADIKNNSGFFDQMGLQGIKKWWRQMRHGEEYADVVSSETTKLARQKAEMLGNEKRDQRLANFEKAMHLKYRRSLEKQFNRENAKIAEQNKQLIKEGKDPLPFKTAEDLKAAWLEKIATLNETISVTDVNGNVSTMTRLEALKKKYSYYVGPDKAMDRVVFENKIVAHQRATDLADLRREGEVGTGFRATVLQEWQQFKEWDLWKTRRGKAIKWVGGIAGFAGMTFLTSGTFPFTMAAGLGAYYGFKKGVMPLAQKISVRLGGEEKRAAKADKLKDKLLVDSEKYAARKKEAEDGVIFYQQQIERLKELESQTDNPEEVAEYQSQRIGFERKLETLQRAFEMDQEKFMKQSQKRMGRIERLRENTLDNLQRQFAAGDIDERQLREGVQEIQRREKQRENMQEALAKGVGAAAGASMRYTGASAELAQMTGDGLSELFGLDSGAAEGVGASGNIAPGENPKNPLNTNMPEALNNKGSLEIMSSEAVDKGDGAVATIRDLILNNKEDIPQWMEDSVLSDFNKATGLNVSDLSQVPAGYEDQLNKSAVQAALKLTEDTHFSDYMRGGYGDLDTQTVGGQTTWSHRESALIHPGDTFGFTEDGNFFYQPVDGELVEFTDQTGRATQLFTDTGGQMINIDAGPVVAPSGVSGATEVVEPLTPEGTAANLGADQAVESAGSFENPLINNEGVAGEVPDAPAPVASNPDLGEQINGATGATSDAVNNNQTPSAGSGPADNPGVPPRGPRESVIMKDPKVYRNPAGPGVAFDINGAHPYGVGDQTGVTVEHQMSTQPVVQPTQEQTTYSATERRGPSFSSATEASQTVDQSRLNTGRARSNISRILENQAGTGPRIPRKGFLEPFFEIFNL